MSAARHRVALAGVLLGGAIALASHALASFTAPGVGASTAATGTLAPASNVVASSASDTDVVQVSWLRGVLGTGQAAPVHVVTRVRTADGASFPACGSTLAAPLSGVACTDNGVTDGTYVYTVTAMFGSWTATSAPSAPVQVINDSSLPSIAVTGISPGANANGYIAASPVTVTLSASAGFGVESVTYAIDGGAPVTVPGSGVSVQVSGERVHELTFTARDTLGYVSDTGSLLVRIDLTAPIRPAAPTLVAASDSGASAADGTTSDTTPTFTGTVEDGATVTLYDGAVAIATTPASGGVYTVTAPVVAEGTRSFSVAATDLAGNVGTTSLATVVTVDMTAPAPPGAPVLAAASDSGRSSTDRITKVTTPVLTGTAESGSTVTLFNGTAAVGSAGATGTAWSVTSSTLTTGARSLSARATDLAGNVGPASAVTTVTIDISAPGAPSTPRLTAATDTGRSSTDNNTRNPAPTFASTGTAGYTVELLDNLVVVVTSLTTATGSATGTPGYTLTSVPLSEGTHPIRARYTDVAGNVSLNSNNRSVVIDTVAPPAPSAPSLTSATDTGRSTSDKITASSAPAVSGTNASRAIVTLYEDARLAGMVTTSSTTYSVATGLLSNGPHTFTGTSTDIAGNVGPLSLGATFTVDRTAPTVTLAQANTQADPASSSPIVFTATFSETVFSLTGAGVTLSGTAGATIATPSGSGTTWPLAVSGMLRSGSVVAALNAGAAVDTAGNPAAASTSVDNTVAYTDVSAPAPVLSTFTASAGTLMRATGTAGTAPGDSGTVTVSVCTENTFPCPAASTRATLSASVSSGVWSVTSDALGPQSALWARATQDDLSANTGLSAVRGPVATLA